MGDTRFLRVAVNLGPDLRAAIDELKMRYGFAADEGRFAPMPAIEAIAIMDVLLERIEALEAAAVPLAREPEPQ